MAADLLAEWDGKEFLFARPSDPNKIVRIDWPLRDELDNVEEKFREAFDELGVTEPKTVALAIARELLVFRLLDLPTSDPAEVPMMVQYQLGTATGTPPEELHTDFLILPAHGEEGTPVFSANLPHGTRNHLVAIGERLGFRWTRWVPAAVPLLQEGLGEQSVAGNLLILWQHGHEFEWVAARDGSLIGSHHGIFPGRDPNGLAAFVSREQKRFLFSLKKNGGFDQIQRVVVLCESEHRSLFEILFETDHPDAALLIRPAADRTDSPVLSGLAEWNTIPSEARLDFLNPRKPTEKRDRRPLVFAILGLLLLGTGLVLWNVRRGTIADLEALTTDLREQVDDLEDKNRERKPVAAASQAVIDWDANRGGILEALRTLDSSRPVPSSVAFQTFGFDRRPTELRTVAAGTAGSRGAIQTVTQTLLENESLTVTPQEIVEVESKDGTRYQFQLNLQSTP